MISMTMTQVTQVTMSIFDLDLPHWPTSTSCCSLVWSHSSILTLPGNYDISRNSIIPFCWHYDLWHLVTQCLRGTWCQRQVGRCHLAIARIPHHQDTAFSPSWLMITLITFLRCMFSSSIWTLLAASFIPELLRLLLKARHSDPHYQLDWPGGKFDVLEIKRPRVENYSFFLGLL